MKTLSVAVLALCLSALVGAHSTDASAEHATQDPKASTQYQIKATGALVR